MPSVNKAILIGHLGKDPELRYTPGGQAVCDFSLATSEKWKDKDGVAQDKTEWHNITAWGRQAETCKEFLSKGRPVYIEGRIETQKWQDKEGRDRYTTKIIAQRVQFLGGKAADPAQTEIPDTSPEVETDNDNDDDLPF